MIDDSKYIFRKATTNDIDFLSKAIVEAKKGGSDMVGMANLFELSEEEFRKYVSLMLEEEIDGCDFSVSSFIIAEYDERPVATFAGWIEGANEDEMPSSVLKSNLIGYVIPHENIQKAQEKAHLLENLQIERVEGTYQLEYGYTIPVHRGHHLIGRLIEKHVERAKASSVPVSKMQVLVYDNNKAAITAYTKAGFKVIQELVADNNEVLKYYPHNREIFLEKEL
ncbi:MAG: GNAT family N-acetyltransferase [Prevotella sp.]|nr:GNAT family N-acetyltransferase [Prevotella sp.]